MESLASSEPTLPSRWLPFAAVFVDDVRQAARHWAVWTWIVFSSTLTLGWLIAAAGNAPALGAATATDREASRFMAFSSPADPQAPREFPTESYTPLAGRITAAQFGAKVMGAHLLLWSTFIIILGATSLSSEAEIAPETVFCRGVGRIEYFVAKLTARCFVVATLFLVLTLPPMALAEFRL
ncbi:MAG: hypothetical protein ACRDD1_12025, partial [Planctomycetia bacterium]